MVSNFIFRRGPEQSDPWLIDDISMNIGSKALSRLAYFRWRGRMLLSLRGFDIKTIVRMDYATDYFILTSLSV